MIHSYFIPYLHHPPLASTGGPRVPAEWPGALPGPTLPGPEGPRESPGEGHLTQFSSGYGSGPGPVSNGWNPDGTIHQPTS